MRKLLIMFCALFVIIGCKTKYNILDDMLQTKVMVTDTITVVGKHFDQYCASRNIPGNLDLWDANYLKDYETDKKITQYIYVLGNDIFRVNKTDTTYFVTHRYFK